LPPLSPVIFFHSFLLKGQGWTEQDYRRNAVDGDAWICLSGQFMPGEIISIEFKAKWEEAKKTILRSPRVPSKIFI
jgi:hypothetical protein